MAGIDASQMSPGFYSSGTGASVGYRNTRATVVQNPKLHPHAIPLLLSQKNYRTGCIVPVSLPGSTNRRVDYRFNFMFNPTDVTVTSSYDDGIATGTGQPPDGVTMAPLGAQTIEFTTVLVRQDDMDSPGSNPGTDSAQGTLADLEVLWNVLFGDARMLRQDVLQGLTAGTADLGYLPSTPVAVYFGHYYSVAGRITSLRAHHIKFNPDMIPIITELQITMMRVIGDLPTLQAAAATAPTPAPSTKTSAKSNRKFT